MRTSFIFDVDGTLTPSRGRIDPEFHDYFLNFCNEHDVYLVTGSDYRKTEEQLGSNILAAVNLCFNCAGNSVWSKGKEIYSYNWKPDPELVFFLEEKAKGSKFIAKGWTNIESRPGMINFSIIGRPSTFETRYLYKQWDEDKQERLQIAMEVMDKFPGIVAQVAGETGIDIYEQGKDKSQIAKYVKHPVIFFGDKMQVGGNDYPLAVKLEGYPQSKSIQVKDWQDTYGYLQAVASSV